ncbi:hypothetical protein IPC1257_18860 [Pseudomonas aeruginosa]|nr:hypothetical protein IPC1257_18860 [Pseudomonas aeruginosa]RPT27883.1 hypothetical protein IPC977_05810 [Pseudomonas aeruginosa]RPT84750.1 hypothetical protein IPC935_15935 [Pseudomonas aeruginosa]
MLVGTEIVGDQVHPAAVHDALDINRPIAFHLLTQATRKISDRLDYMDLGRVAPAGNPLGDDTTQGVGLDSGNYPVLAIALAAVAVGGQQILLPLRGTYISWAIRTGESEAGALAVSLRSPLALLIGARLLACSGCLARILLF